MSKMSMPANTEAARLEDYIVNRIRSVLPEVQAIYLFGSRATGQARPDSDYDIAILYPGSALNGNVYFQLQLELAALTEAGVNLVDLRGLPIVLQFEVLRGRKRLFCGDLDFCTGYEAGILSEYQRFEEERRPIITAFLNRRGAHV